MTLSVLEGHSPILQAFSSAIFRIYGESRGSSAPAKIVNSYFGRLSVFLLNLDWTFVAAVFCTGICLITQSNSPGGANGTKTGESRWVLPRIYS